jgi:hypothetical protein
MMSGPAVPILGDLLRYTLAPIISWTILPSAFRKLFAPRSVPQKCQDEFPASLTIRPKQLRAAAIEPALHQSFGIIFPVLVSVGANLISAVISPFIGVAHGDPISAKAQSAFISQDLSSSAHFRARNFTMSVRPFTNSERFRQRLSGA